MERPFLELLLRHAVFAVIASRIIAAKVASATTLPSTLTSPENFQTLPRLRSFVTCTCRWSPGTTGPAEPRSRRST